MLFLICSKWIYFCLRIKISEKKCQINHFIIEKAKQLLIIYFFRIWGKFAFNGNLNVQPKIQFLIELEPPAYHKTPSPCETKSSLRPGSTLKIVNRLFLTKPINFHFFPVRTLRKFKVGSQANKVFKINCLKVAQGLPRGFPDI